MAKSTWYSYIILSVSVNELIIEKGAALDVANYRGQTPFMHMEERNCLELIELIRSYL